MGGGVYKIVKIFQHFGVIMYKDDGCLNFSTVESDFPQSHSEAKRSCFFFLCNFCV